MTTVSIQEGEVAPGFNAITDGNKQLKLTSLKGKIIVLYFYPKDDTPGCTRESCEFASKFNQFKKKNAQIVGVSRDSVDRHDKFKAKYSLPFNLISDENGKICNIYDTWKEKKNYGRVYMGVERTTYLIDQNLVIRRIWRKVRVNGHVDEVLKAVKSL